MAEFYMSPARRATEDLQKILETLMGTRESVLCSELPSLLRAYEKEHDITILDPSDYDKVEKQAEAHPDLTLEPENLFQFLSICTQLGRPTPSSPTPHLSHSTSLPPTSFRQLTDRTPRPKKHNRRLSDRIRSPSDSSSSSDEGNNQPYFRPRGERQPSAPPLPFARSQTNLPHLSDSALPPLPGQRGTTSSDTGKYESPLVQRIRAAGKGKPPSSFAFGGTAAFARPSPASRRRRGSTSGQSASGAEDAKSPDFPPSATFHRSVSSASIALATSPLMSPVSPRSPNGLDNTSFHERAKSPEAMSETGAVEDEMRDMDDVESRDEGGDEVDEVDDMGEVQGMAADPRLSRISTESSASLRTSHDKLRSLQKQNTELSRKLKESERQLAVLGSENERLVEDLQDKLEEARSEITQRRKDEKEWKGKERTLMIQISGFEADISSLQRSLENAKQNHASMQKMYNSQCDEAQRLRDLLRDRDNEIRNFELSAQAHEADEEKFSTEISALESEIKRLESDLNTARQAEGYLENQKQENLQLKETIDRMRFDLDEARAAAMNGTGHTRGPTSSSGPATLSRNLGDELHRRLLDAERVREDAVEEDAEEYVETVVTTQRTRKLGNKPNNTATTGNQPSIRIEEGIKEYADVGTATDPELAVETPQPVAGPSTVADEPPAYTRTPDPLNEKDILDRAHPQDGDIGTDVDEDYESLVGALGRRCTVLEEEMKKRAIIARKTGSDIVDIPGQTRSMSRRKAHERLGIVNVYYQNQTGSLIFCIGAAVIVGMSLGAHMFGAPHGMHPRDYHLFGAMNSLAVGAGVGEGFMPATLRVWEVMSMTTGRVPS